MNLGPKNFAKGKGPRGLNLCRCGCGREAVPPRRNWHSQDCVTKWKLSHDWKFIRARVLERDHGVCAKCGRDCLAVQHEGWELWKRRTTPGLPFWFVLKHPGFTLSRDYWEVHHTTPRSLGGSHAMSELATWCHACHRVPHGRKSTLGKKLLPGKQVRQT